MPFHDDGQLISTSSATVADPRTFYDELAGEYHMLFLDWWDSAQRQGEVIGGLLRQHGVAPPATVLDCTCGIGTQALPLAAAGYRVVGSDLSEPATARAVRGTQRPERAVRGTQRPERVVRGTQRPERVVQGKGLDREPPAAYGGGWNG